MCGNQAAPSGICESSPLGPRVGVSWGEGLSERRDRLRAATAESHAALDAVVGDWRIETPLGYGAFLSASAAALAPLEVALERAGVTDWLPDWPRRTRRVALDRDLAALGLQPAPSGPAFVPSRDFGAGLLYVLEGSRLGARFLARQARAGLDDPPLAYLTHGHEDDLWRSFLLWLEAIPKVGFRTDAAEEGARYGFRCFSDAFERLISPGAFNVRDAVHIRV